MELLRCNIRWIRKIDLQFLERTFFINYLNLMTSRQSIRDNLGLIDQYQVLTLSLSPDCGFYYGGAQERFDKFRFARRHSVRSRQ